ncbi:TetR/AcrR family transcriptional regulator [Vagococcus coleopterorum]|uniref:TetR/AcrR family transcriptional regulator n=1 Tax=Vagococcus coleopterorum TaxID=2714946 RepID=A0A6G8AN44_9ENTE|nr:TetR/AcrR family transcriptional regulator [Vagococcus coleopterorum]QIL46362.1 TetR/AcrR family transcriptional regulator [Vagococcus coleopterorum]
MPKETFFNLPLDKQERLMEAARVEFARAPLQEASIAKIVKLADISRGSFYQYFEDKEDLYYYYFEKIRTNNEQKLEYQLKKHKGDIFNAAKNYFDEWIFEVLKGPHCEFYRNLLMFMDYRGTAKVSPEIANNDEWVEKNKQRAEKHKEKVASLMDIIDTSTLKVDDDGHLSMLIKLVTGMMFTSINHAYKMEMHGMIVDIDEIKKEFNTKLEWIQFGVTK